MFLIGLRLLMVLAIACLFGVFFAWLVSFFNGSSGGGWDDRGDEPDPKGPSDPGGISQPKQEKKRLVEVDESYYLEEFDLSDKK